MGMTPAMVWWKAAEWAEFPLSQPGERRLPAHRVIWTRA
jgi:hypothetical protein